MERCLLWLRALFLASGVVLLGSCAHQDVKPGVYEVRKGDNLFRIAGRLGIDYQSLARLNGIKNPDDLRVGQKLYFNCVRSGQGPRCPMLAEQEQLPRVERRLYQVQAGDNLFRIASRLGIDYQSLVRLNGIKNPDDLKVGQKLYFNCVRSGQGPRCLTVAEQEKPSRKEQAERESFLAQAPFLELVEATLYSPLAGTDLRLPGEQRWLPGVEITGNPGDLVRCAANGTMIFVGQVPQLGLAMVVRHGGYGGEITSVYSGISEALAQTGEKVQAGRGIARLGEEGALYFEVRRGSQPLDLMQLLGPDPEPGDISGQP